MIVVDGSRGEGGGQILRTALALSTITGKPFEMRNIRSKRKRPGLMRQHLTCVQAAAHISNANVLGGEIASQDLVFTPGPVRGGDYKFAIGTAGSTTLVLQTVLWGLLAADTPSRVTLEGGTHNPNSPPFDFLQRTFVPLLSKMGVQVKVSLVRPGFYPGGGGQIVAEISPGVLQPLRLITYTEPKVKRAVAMLSNLPLAVATRQLAVVRQRLGIEGTTQFMRNGVGNTVTIDIVTDDLTEVFTGFGERDVSAEDVAGRVCAEAERFLAEKVPVGEYLADQLILPFALARGGAFRTHALSDHATTQIETVQQFLDVKMSAEGGVLAVEADVGAHLV